MNGGARTERMGEEDEPGDGVDDSAGNPHDEPAQLLMISQMSRRKKSSTAASVPSWVIAVNAAPGS